MLIHAMLTTIPQYNPTISPVTRHDIIFKNSCIYWTWCSVLFESLQ